MRRKGNALVLFIFVLLACSLIGLLGTRFLQQSMGQYQQVNAYYKNYYFAKAGIELALTQLPLRGFGFSQSGDLSLGERNFGSGIHLHSDIIGAATGFCPILSGKDSLVIPLFVDKGVSLFRVFSSIPVYDYETRVGVLNGSHGLSLSSSETPHLLHLGLVVAQHSGLVQDGVYVSSGMSNDPSLFSAFYTRASKIFINSTNKLLRSWTDNSDLQTFLVLSNMDNSVFHLCLSSPQALPLGQYSIVSSSSLGGGQIDLEAISRQPLPSFFLESSYK